MSKEELELIGKGGAKVELLDYFAGQAMLVLLPEHDPLNRFVRTAESAYDMAEAMIKEKIRRKLG